MKKIIALRSGWIQECRLEIKRNQSQWIHLFTMNIIWFVKRKPITRLIFCILAILFIATSYIIAKEYVWHDKFIQSRLQPTSLEAELRKREITQIQNENMKKVCVKEYFKNILLIISFGAEVEYESIPLFELLYAGGFPNRVYCSPTKLPNETDVESFIVDTKRGAFQYECLLRILEEKNYTYDGYLFTAEEILINYWTMTNLDLTKLWIDSGVSLGPIMYQQIPDGWEWWGSPWGMRALEKVFETFVEIAYTTNRKSKLSDGEWVPEWDVNQALNSWLWNGKGDYYSYRVDRTITYLPRKYQASYIEIAKRFRGSGVRHAIGFPTILYLLDRKTEFINLKYAAMESEGAGVLKSRLSLDNATDTHHFLYVKGGRKERREVLGDLKIKELAMGRFLIQEMCKHR